MKPPKLALAALFAMLALAFLPGNVRAATPTSFDAGSTSLMAFPRRHHKKKGRKKTKKPKGAKVVSLPRQ